VNSGFQLGGMSNKKLTGPYQGSMKVFYYGSKNNADLFSGIVRESGLASIVRVDPVFPQDISV